MNMKKFIFGIMTAAVIAIAAFSGLSGGADRFDTFSAAPEASAPSSSVSNQSAANASYQFRKPEYLEQHFEKHGAELGCKTAQEYLNRANKVINSASALRKNEKEDNDDIYYIESTNEIVFVSGDGYIRTYFKASRDYFDRQ